MHSVPGNLLDQLKAVADRTGMTYTDIVLECVVSHRRALAAQRHEVDDMDVLERRVRRVRRQRQRAVQLTLYLSAEEREALDELAARLALQRSQLVTEALERGLEEIA
ncbi:MAG: CopG family transcriptional regulator [Egibacteraceae bacterium]